MSNNLVTRYGCVFHGFWSSFDDLSNEVVVQVILFRRLSAQYHWDGFTFPSFRYSIPLRIDACRVAMRQGETRGNQRTNGIPTGNTLVSDHIRAIAKETVN